MSIKERISDLFEKYSVQLEVEEKEEEKKEKETSFATATLDSGQEIQTDAEAFAVGVSVFVVNDEGEQIPLPDGSYTLADGVVLVVVDGVVSEMQEVEEAPAEAAPEAVVEEVAMSREEIVSLIAKAVAQVKKEFSSQIKERDAKITELSKTASAKISRAPKMEVKAPVDMTKLSMKERIAAIQNQFSL